MISIWYNTDFFFENYRFLCCKLKISITNYRFLFCKLHISIKQITDFHFFLLRFVNYSKLYIGLILFFFNFFLEWTSGFVIYFNGKVQGVYTKLQVRVWRCCYQGLWGCSGKYICTLYLCRKTLIILNAELLNLLFWMWDLCKWMQSYTLCWNYYFFCI